MVLHVIRAFFLLVVLAITVSFAFHREVIHQGTTYITAYILIPVAMAFALVLGDIVWPRKRLQVFSGLFFGVLAGLAIAYMLALIVDLVVAVFPTPPAAVSPGLEPRPPQALGAEATPQRRAAHQQAMMEFLAARQEYDQELAAYSAYTGHLKTVQLVKLLLGQRCRW